MVGVLKAAEKRSTFSPDNKPETGHLLWAEKAALLQAAGLGQHGAEEGVQPVPILMEAVGESYGCVERFSLTRRQLFNSVLFLVPISYPACMSARSR